MGMEGPPVKRQKTLRRLARNETFMHRDYFPRGPNSSRVFNSSGARRAQRVRPLSQHAPLPDFITSAAEHLISLSSTARNEHTKAFRNY